ncbi:MAG: ABA4-like family protein [Bacteroidota bacterium]
MTPAEIFRLVNTIILPAWLILVFFPKKKWRNPVIYTFAALMSGLYSFHVVTGLSNFNPEVFNSLQGIMDLFTQEEAVLAGWIHYLVFDLLVGNWIVNQSIKHGIKHYLVIPCLFFCFMFGPLGYLLFFVIKTIKTKNVV